MPSFSKLKGLGRASAGDNERKERNLLGGGRREETRADSGDTAHIFILLAEGLISCHLVLGLVRETDKPPGASGSTTKGQNPRTPDGNWQ